MHVRLKMIRALNVTRSSKVDLNMCVLIICKLTAWQKIRRLSGYVFFLADLINVNGNPGESIGLKSNKSKLELFRTIPESVS